MTCCNADTVVRDNIAIGNQFGIFVRHARHVTVFHNLATRNCQGILVLDDGQPGGAGTAVITDNTVLHNNKFCKKSMDTPVNLRGGGILLLGATRTLVAHNEVNGNHGLRINSGGIVVLSAKKLTHGHNPRHDTILGNVAFHNRPAYGSGRQRRRDPLRGQPLWPLPAQWPLPLEHIRWSAPA